MDTQGKGPVSVPNKGPIFTVSTSILTSIAALLVIYRLSWAWIRSTRIAADDIIIAASMVCGNHFLLNCHYRLIAFSRLFKLSIRLWEIWVGSTLYPTNWPKN